MMRTRGGDRDDEGKAMVRGGIVMMRTRGGDRDDEDKGRGKTPA